MQSDFDLEVFCLRCKHTRIITLRWGKIKQQAQPGRFSRIKISRDFAAGIKNKNSIGIMRIIRFAPQPYWLPGPQKPGDLSVWLALSPGNACRQYKINWTNRQLQLSHAESDGVRPAARQAGIPACYVELRAAAPAFPPLLWRSQSLRRRKRPESHVFRFRSVLPSLPP